MKIGILSDIHTDINYSEGDRVTPALVREIEQNDIDVMLIAGDLASDYTISASVVQTLRRESGIPVLFTPGNHDIWNENHPDLDSWTIYNRLMEIPGNLAAGPVDIDERWTVVGDLGWFDYSLGGDSFSKEELSLMKYGGREWQDHIYAVWGRAPEEMHRFFYNKLVGSLETLRNRQVILATHMLPSREFTVGDDHPQAELWTYFNAFLGSEDYGSLADTYPQIKVSISGHVHYRKRFSRNGTLFLCNCLGYTSEWDGTEDPAVEVPRTLITLDTETL